MGHALFLVVILAALGGAEAVLYTLRFFAERKQEELRRRLRSVGEADAGIQLFRRRRVSSSTLLEELFGGVGLVQRLERLIEQADSDWTVVRLGVYSLLGAGALGAPLVGMGRGLLLGLGAAVLGGALPVGLLLRRRSQRRQRISEQLPDALEMMARSLRAGHAIASSLKLVAQEMAAPIAVEFAQAFEQQNLGLPLDQAVVAMTERVPGNTDLSIFAVSIVVQHETGGNLVELLEKIAETIRERYRFYGKLRALTAEGRLGGIILGALPLVVGLLISIINRGYVAELATGLGRSLLIVGVISWAVGLLWMRQLAQVDY